MAEEILGGTGPELPRAHQEHRLIARLQRSGQWVIPERIYKSGPEVLAAIAENESAEPKERNGALRTLVMMGNANTGQASVDVRINQQIAIVEAPVVPDNVDTTVQPAWVEIVNTDNMDATVAELQASGLMSMYLDQVKNKPQPLPSNGNGGLN